MVTIDEPFVAHFGRTPAYVGNAGGRVNLIGEHTDYHEGLVLPAAIDLRTWVAAAPRTDGILRVHSEQVGEQAVVHVADLCPPEETTWVAYVLGPFWALREEGFLLPGADVLIRSNVPFGGGLSSSASLQVALVGVGAHLAGRPVAREQAARLAHRAENEFCHVPCGAMDPIASACGRELHALLLDCRTLQVDRVPIPSHWAILIADSGVKHSVAGKEYAMRQQECAQGMDRLRKRHPSLRSARDLSLNLLETEREHLSEVSFRRLRHVVTENARVLEARRALEEGDAPRMGRLLLASHHSLAVDYEVSCPELDELVRVAMATPGVIGARLTGAGWGGNTVNIVHRDEAEQACGLIRKAYEQRTGRCTNVRVVRASKGLEVARG